MGSRQKFIRRFAEEIRKLVGNVKGDRREEYQWTLPQDCLRLPEYVGQRLDRSCQRIQAAARRCRRVNCPNGDSTAHTIDYGQRPTANGG
ncbi:hypothetical protein B296_00005632 [Ensete ventricosum]|uniref:Uncharacterized protein n=1 Tax=Ensete ventricosum TaxID=4639 RepID=A0A426ZYM3_ENSVE|nr:hypothetical protein B296_00005632 [Ensete ventricosum]